MQNSSLLEVNQSRNSLQISATCVWSCRSADTNLIHTFCGQTVLVHGCCWWCPWDFFFFNHLHFVSLLSSDITDGQQLQVLQNNSNWGNMLNYWVREAANKLSLCKYSMCQSVKIDKIYVFLFQYRTTGTNVISGLGLCGLSVKSPGTSFSCTSPPLSIINNLFTDLFLYDTKSTLVHRLMARWSYSRIVCWM